MKKFVVVLIVMVAFLMQNSVFAQKEFYNWNFGIRGDLTFNTADGLPVAIGNSVLESNEGCASISSPEGDLLFYTNGVNVWNKNHKQMPNGAGLFGSVTSSQSALIVRSPLESNIYFIFTVDFTGYNPFGMEKEIKPKFCYSIVDMNLDGGLGDITQKNVLIYSGVCEKQTAIRHKNGKDIWVVAHEYDSDRFVIVRLNSDGSVSKPILRSAGSKHFKSNLGSFYDENGIGYMKFSPKANKIAVAIYRQNTVDILDFDNETGSLSNCITFSDSINLLLPYGVEFSPDGTKLYISEGKENFPRIFQFDLNQKTRDSIFNNRYIFNFDTNKYTFLGALQTGPDGRIYVSSWTQSYLSYINNPNNSGSACNFCLNCVPLIPRYISNAGGGLPNFVYSPFEMSLSMLGDTLCEGDTLKLISNAITKLPNELYDWSGPNGFRSFLKKPVIPKAKQSMSGYYRLTVTSNSNALTDSVFILINPKPNAKILFVGDSAICDGSPVIMNAVTDDTAYCFFKWSTGETTQQITVTKGGKYSVKVTNKSGCTDSASTIIKQSSKPYLMLKPLGKTKFCEGDSVLLLSSSEQSKWINIYNENFNTRTSYPEWTSIVTDKEWQGIVKMDKSTDDSIHCLGVFGNQKVDLNLKNLKRHDSVEVTYDLYIIGTWDGDSVSANGPDIFKISEAYSNPPFKDSTSFSNLPDLMQSYPGVYPFGRYKPKTGSTRNLMFSVPEIYYDCALYKFKIKFAHTNSSLDYTFEAKLKDKYKSFSNECWALDNFKVNILEVVPPDTTYHFKWSTGDTSQIITAKKTGMYKVTVTNPMGCTNTDSIFVDVIPAFNASITGATTFCEGDLTTLHAEPQGADFNYRWSTGETTKSIIVNKEGIYGVQVTRSNLCTDESSVTVKVNPLPIVKITGDTIACPGATTKLSTDKDFASYLWSNGEKTKEITISKPDIYTVSVTDTNGCNNTSAPFNFKNFKINLTGLENIDFGTQTSGIKYSKTLILTNESNTSIDVDSIKTIKNLSVFSISTKPLLPCRLSIGSQIELTVEFISDKIDAYSDDIVVDITNPCPSKITSNISANIQPGKTLVWLPDVTAKIGEDNFCIPLTVRKDEVPINETLSYEAEIRFNPTAMLPNNYSSEVIDGERVIKISGDNIRFKTNEFELTSFCSKIFLPDTDRIPLKIHSFRWSNDKIIADRKDGSLKVTGICQPGIARISLIPSNEFQIVNNPVSDILEINLPVGVQLAVPKEIEIFNILGVLYTPPNPLLIEGEQLRLDVSGFVPGVYFVKIGDKVSKFIKV